MPTYYYRSTLKEGVLPQPQKGRIAIFLPVPAAVYCCCFVVKPRRCNLHARTCMGVNKVQGQANNNNMLGVCVCFFPQKEKRT